MKLQGRWGTVADDAWDMDDAEVVCQQLGCGSAAGAYLASRFRLVDTPIMMAFIDCQGDEAALWDCNIRGWGPYKGPHDYDTAVVCQGERWAQAALGSPLRISLSAAAHLSWQGSPGWPEGTASAQEGWRCGRARPGSASAMATWTSWPPRSSAGSWAVVLQWPYPELGSLEQQHCRSGMAPSSATAPSPSFLLAHSSLLTLRPAPMLLQLSAPVSSRAMGLHQPHAVWHAQAGPHSTIPTLSCSLHQIPAGGRRLNLHRASGGGGTRGVGTPVCHCLGPA